MHPPRVIVRLPYNRPEEPLSDPVPVAWSPEKENYLWDSIAKSRATEGGSPDWKVLAQLLEVPLPYLLYRAQTRYEQDLRGLQDIRGSLSPPTPQATPSRTTQAAEASEPSPVRVRSSVTQLTTPLLGVRARLNSLGNNSTARMNKASSSSVLTLRGGHRKDPVTRRPVSPLSSGSEDEDEAEGKERAETAERAAEEQEELDRKLARLQQMMTSDALGLVSGPAKLKRTDRGRMTSSLPHPSALRRRGQDSSQSISSASSPQGSIPSIPSPSAGTRSPVRDQHFVNSDARQNGQTTSPAFRLQQRHAGSTKPGKTSDKGSSNYGSSASSYSDISTSEADLLGSALESAIMSNIRGGGSRFSSFTSRSHVRGSGLPH